MHGTWEINISTEFHGVGTENNIKSDVSTGTVWTGTGYQHFFGDCLDGVTGTIIARERREKVFVPCNPARGFSRGRPTGQLFIPDIKKSILARSVLQFFFSIFPEFRYFPTEKKQEIPKIRENTGKKLKIALVKGRS